MNAVEKMGGLECSYNWLISSLTVDVISGIVMVYDVELVSFPVSMLAVLGLPSELGWRA